MSSLACKPNAAEAVERLRALYERRAPDRIFAAFAMPAGQTLAEFKKTHRAGECDYPDPSERIAFWAKVMDERPRVDDDSLPFVYPCEMDQGLYGGVLGGEVHFNCNPDTGWISSMVPRLLKDWSELDRLSFSPSHPWFKRYLEQLRIYAEGARGKFGICPFVLINGLNFIFELVGATETYMAIMDCPDTVRRAIDLGFRVNTAVADAFFEIAPPFMGGTFNLNCQWLPGRTVMESVDPFHMTSTGCFEEWGRTAIERVFARYDGGEIHIHANGRHLLEAASSLKGLKAIHLGNDEGFPPAFTILRELQSRCANVPLNVGVAFEDFAQALESHRLAGGVLYHVRAAPDAASANRLMEKVRAYRL